MYAIFQVGGQQIRAGVGDKVRVELLPQAVGEQVVLNNVLMVADGDNLQVGQPVLSGAAVKATVVEQSKGDKVVVFHYRPGGKRHKVRTGHRQTYTWLRVDEIAGA